MNRRLWLVRGCAHCAVMAAPLWAAGSARAQADYAAPARFTRPDLATDEGGLWAMMDREETRLRRSPFRMKDEGLQDYLQALTCKVAGDHCPDIRVYPLRTPFFNASMAPNGMMQVWSGLLLRAENEAQLVAVLAHEVGHYLQRHTLERLRDVKARTAFGTFFAMLGPVGMVASLATVASAFGFSRDQERDADTIGLVLMERAGYDPREAAKVWANLIAELEANPAADLSRNTPMFATHPTTHERSRVLADLAAGKGGELGEQAYAERIAPLRHAMLDDELKRGRYGETVVLLDRMLRREPGSALLLYFRGETRRLRNAEGDGDAALADLRAATALPQAPPVAHRSLGYLLRAQDQGEAARRSFGRYLELAPDAGDAALIRTYLTDPKAPA